MEKNAYTREELERLAYLMFYAPGAALSMLEREFPRRHSADSWELAYAGMYRGGDDPVTGLHATTLVLTIAEELDNNPAFTGWRERARLGT